MEIKQKLVFDRIHVSYYPIIAEYHLVGTSHYFLGAHQKSPEEYHLIANESNKYWNLIDL